MITNFKIFESELSYDYTNVYIKRKSDDMIGQIEYQETDRKLKGDYRIRYYCRFGRYYNYYTRHEFEFATNEEVKLHLDTLKYNL